MVYSLYQCHVEHCTLSQVFLIYTVFQKLALLPLYCSYIVNVQHNIGIITVNTVSVYGHTVIFYLEVQTSEASKQRNN
jgi:hypothetical protein